MTLTSRSYEITYRSKRNKSQIVFPAASLFYQAQQIWYHATQPGMSLQPTIDIPLIQITGTEPLYEAVGTMQLS